MLKLWNKYILILTLMLVSFSAYPSITLPIPPINICTLPSDSVQNTVPYEFNNTELEIPLYDSTLTDGYWQYMIEYHDMKKCVLYKTNLRIDQSYKFHDTVVVCDSYMWYGEMYDKSGEYEYILPTINGCDSLEVLHLTVNYGDTVDYYITSCDSYTWSDSITYTQSGTYYRYLTTTKGCDSLEVLHLTVNYGDTVDYTHTACDSYTWHGTTYTQSGVYEYLTQTAKGCDSLEVLTLTVNYGDTVDYTHTACDSYTWHGTTYTQSGVYEYLTQTTKGCDSLEVLTLTVNYGDTVDYYITSCDSYTWSDSITYTQSGTYYRYLTTTNGCDSLEVLHLTINYGDTVDYTHTACDSYTWHGTTYTQSGVYEYLTQTAKGCDSLEVLTLIVNYGDTVDYTHTACDSYTWHGTTYTQSGVYEYLTQTTKGCDSLEVLTLTVNYGDTVDYAHTACDSYTWHGTTYTQSGVYEYLTQTTNGCDSLEVLYLTVNYSDTVEYTHTACDYYVWHGIEYTQSGTYEYLTETVLGCDSLEILHLTINYMYIVEQLDTMAGYNPYYWCGDTLYEEGYYTKTLTAVTGCDSVINIQLIGNPVAMNEIIIPEYCAGDNVICLDIHTEGYIDYMHLMYSSEGQNAGLKDTIFSSNNQELCINIRDVQVGKHTASLKAFFHQEEVLNQDLLFTILYPSSIFEQQWNDVIAVLTEKYNGGYQFTAFQWYKDGQMLPNETASYIHQPLSIGAEYSVLLTDANGMQLMSCPIVAIDQADISVYPTILRVGESVKCHITDAAAILLYNSTGHILTEYQVDKGDFNINMPHTSGIYMLRISTANNNVREVKILVR